MLVISFVYGMHMLLYNLKLNCLIFSTGLNGHLLYLYGHIL